MRECEWCGADMSHKRRDARFCRRLCANSAGRSSRRKAELGERVCVACGTDISHRQSSARTCSRACHSWNVRNPNTPYPKNGRCCGHCGDDISFMDAKAKFCSRLCGERSRDGVQRGAEKECPECFQPFIATKRPHVYCSLGCRRSADYKRNADRYKDVAAEYRARKVQATIERFSKVSVFERDNYMCYLCGVPTDKESKWPSLEYPTIDHVIPLIRGGEHSLANVRTAHFLCNVRKRERDLDELEWTVWQAEDQHPKIRVLAHEETPTP